MGIIEIFYLSYWWKTLGFLIQNCKDDIPTETYMKTTRISFVPDPLRSQKLGLRNISCCTHTITNFETELYLAFDRDA